MSRELEHGREAEIMEMVEIYVERGMNPDDAEVRIRHLLVLFCHHCG